MRRRRRTYEEPLADVAELGRLVRAAARPLHPKVEHELPETYPSGV